MRNMNQAKTGEVSSRRPEPYSKKHSHLCRDSIVEVTSKIEGYVWSWYKAKVLKPPQLPKSKFKRKREILIEYTDLLNNDRTQLLRECVDSVLVRPVPPKIVADAAEEEKEEVEEMVFEVGEEVDTYDRDGWWAGTVDRVVRRRTEDGKEENSYVVRFEDPVHEIEFRGYELRLHLDWCDGKWFVSRDGKSQELVVTSDGCVSLASIRSSFKDTTKNDKPVVLAFSANYCLTMAPLDEPISSSLNGKMSPCFPMRYLHEIIDAEYPRGSSLPPKKIKRTCMEDPSVPVSGTSAESTSELCDAEPLCLRPALRLTDNDVNPLRELENKEAASCVTGASNGKNNVNSHATRGHRRRKSSKPTRIILASVALGAAEKADGACDKPSIEEQLFVRTKLSHEEKQGEVQNPETVHWNYSMEEASRMACRTELNHKEQGHSPVVENGGMSPGTEGVSREQPSRDGVIEVDQSLPFVKSSPIWQAVESLEVFRKFPQNPHFLPLIEEGDVIREGLAIAKMVTFANTMEYITKLSIDDPSNRFTDCLETLRCLELHGFDTKAIDNRLTKLMALKDEQEKMEKMKNEVKNQISELACENTELSKDISEIVDKIRDYQEQLSSALLSKEEKDRKISNLRNSLDVMDVVTRRSRLGFEELNLSW